ncbi:MAG: DNA mismatch repair endonuclease MutL [Gammaproteobacteria bacterium]|nr:DNA mismatch repair endonuclease MutL [Gammaproteobacteria bacterium]
MTSGVIRQLPEELALQIAAGEVVERPASIVKELVENSLDAGARNIEIKIEGGGIGLIEVIDDGHGIRREQLQLSLATHSTSKISTADDLESITTMGFRGEALASIASVAKLSIISKHQEEEQAWAIDADGGQIGELRPAALAVGTRIVVKDIFFNLPARRKFLRTLATEFHNIEQTFIRLALGNHQVSFSLSRDDKIIYKLVARGSASDTNDKDYIGVQRIQELVDKDIAEHFVEVDDEAMDYRLRGWTVSPVFALSANANQFLYVNGRFVRDKIFSNAIKRGYEERLHGQRTPSYIFYLTLPPTEVDVNVHPAKYEVRFHKGQQVHSLVRRSISKAIAKPTANYKMPLSAADEDVTTRGESNSPQGKLNYAAPRAGYKAMASNPGANYSSRESVLKPPPLKDFNKVKEALAPFNVSGDVFSDLSKNASVNELRSTASTRSSNEQAALSDITEFMPTLGYAVAQLQGIYIIAINSAGLIVVDMHAAHERVVFESLKDQRTRNKIEQQQFLLPLMLELLPGEVDFVEENLEKFSKWGLQLRVMGVKQVAVDSMPIELDKGNVTEMVKNLCTDFREYSASGVNVEQEINEKVLATMACYGSVRANRNMTIAEMNNLLRKLEKTPSGHLCNHGRPTWFQIERKEIDKKLLRGQ